MTKYEWESELKKNIHRLPSDEIKRVMEYYDELFADKIEQGLKETEIVSQFGNPVDVADKILSDYDGEMPEREETPVPSVKKSDKGAEDTEPVIADYKQPSPAKSDTEPMIAEYKEPCKNDGGTAETESKKKSTRKREFNFGRLLAFVLINVFTGFVLFIFAASVWIAFASVTIAGFACAAGGVAGIVISIGTLFGGHAAIAFAQIGISVAAVGIGMIMEVVCFKAIKWLAIGTKKFFGLIFDWVYEKKEVAQ